MAKRKLIIGGCAALAALSFATYFFVDFVIEPPGSRAPASVPTNYDTLRACEKLDLLWEKVQSSSYKKLPKNRKFGLFQLMALSKQEVALKGSTQSDFAPEGWKKYLHGRGSIAKVKIVGAGSKYTGLFQGAECALLRLSLTYRPSGDKPVAPGLAFKVLRDNQPSANISALVSLDGQGKDFNFFKYPMSNIVPIGKDIGQKMVHEIFRRASTYPEELMLTEMASFTSTGEAIKDAISPRQIFFVPNRSLKFESSEHEIRNDFATIPKGTVIYQIHAASDKQQDFKYSQYTDENAATFLEESQHIADIVTASEFVSSEFGDDGIFFRHQLRP